MESPNYSVTLRLRHPNADPAELSRRLGLEPQHAWRAGEARRLDNGELAGGRYRDTYWVCVLLTTALQLGGGLPLRRDPLASGAGPQLVTPAELLTLTLARMRRSDAYWRAFAEQGGTIECVLQVDHGARCNIELPPLLLAMLVERRIAFSIDVDTRSTHRAAAAA